MGPRFAQSFGWPIEPISSIFNVTCDAGLIDGRLTDEDFGQIDAFLAASSKRTFPIFFRLSDPEMPTYEGAEDKYVFRQKDLPGVHYFSIYDPRARCWILSGRLSVRESSASRILMMHPSRWIGISPCASGGSCYPERNPANFIRFATVSPEKAMESTGTACRI